MGLNQIALSNYDTVVAITQNGVNESLAEYLAALNKNVALYYDVDANGNYVPADPSTAYYIFTGTLGYAVDGNNNPIDIVTLSTDTGNQTIHYNITFSSAEFKSTVAPLFDDVQEAGAPWIIQFLVNLQMAEVQLNTLPQAAQQAIQNTLGPLGINTFSIQQLYADLNTAAYDTVSSSIPGMTSFAESIFAGIMASYMASLAANNQLIFGYAVQAPTSLSQPPTLLPTALEFCVTPYTDGGGNHSQPSLDTLNYLVMTQDRPLPSSLPSAWGFNWVDDSTVQGAMAIRHELYLPILIKSLTPMLTTITPTLYVKADGNDGINDQPMALNPCTTTPAFTTTAASTGVVATYSYEPKTAVDTDSFTGGGVSVSLSFSSSCSVSVSGSTVSLSGSVTVSTDVEAVTGCSIDDETMPATTYSWSVDLVLQMDLTANGQLDYAIVNQNFSSNPTVEPQNQSAWDKFWESVGGIYQTFVDDVDIRGSIQSNVLNTIVPALTAAINSPNHFVFPGANTFLFANPQFSGAGDLVVDLTYMTP
jgi:hypothetical protein